MLKTINKTQLKVMEDPKKWKDSLYLGTSQRSSAPLGIITTNKANGDDGIPVELFQIVALNMPANLENSSGHRTGKGQFSLQSQRKAMPKNVQTTTQLQSFHMLAK